MDLRATRGQPAAGEVDRPDPALTAREGGRSFRPDIEGLRAVAILLVVAYHAGIGAGTRRLRRGRRLLRHLRLPHHRAAARRARRPGGSRSPASTRAACARLLPRRRRARRSSWRRCAGCCSRPLRRQDAGGDIVASALLRRQLALRRAVGRLLRPEQRPQPVPAHLVAGGRGAVLPALAGAAHGAVALGRRVAAGAAGDAPPRAARRRQRRVRAVAGAVVASDAATRPAWRLLQLARPGPGSSRWAGCSRWRVPVLRRLPRAAAALAGWVGPAGDLVAARRDRPATAVPGHCGAAADARRCGAARGGRGPADGRREPAARRRRRCAGSAGLVLAGTSGTGRCWCSPPRGREGRSARSSASRWWSRRTAWRS